MNSFQNRITQLFCGRSPLAMVVILSISATGLFAQPHPIRSEPMASLEYGFRKIPDTIQTSVYWYWISDNISKQGVIKDLKAMKKVGINRAFIGNIGLNDIPYGKVKLFSAEWWDILHTALKTAANLGIEIGIFNSPGWSQSGGPWVKPQQSMRYLTSSEVQVTGPAKITKKLEIPNKEFQDVRVIAYPALKGLNSDIRDLEPRISAVPVLENLKYLMDKDVTSSVLFPEGKPLALDIEANQPFPVQSMTIYVANVPTKLEGMLQVKTKQGFETIKNFNVDRSNNELIVGFNPYGPAAIALPATTGQEFRILFTHISEGGGIAEIKLSSAPAVENYVEKTFAKMWPTPFPYWSAYQWPAQPVIEDPAHLIHPDQVRDISKYMSSDGILSWDVPAGNWIIERCGMTPTLVHNSPATPEGTGLETDKMSKKHIAAHFDAFLGEIIRRIPAADRRTWKVAVQDSYETGGQNWTDELIAKFRTTYGYSPLPYLPVMQGKVVGSADQSDRFLWDLRRFIAHNLAYQYVAGLREVCHKNGLTTWLESYGHWGFPGEFLQYGGQSDEVGGEFWTVGDLGAIENRAASSCAHIYGKTKVSSESFTSGSPAFSLYPAMLKKRADQFFTEGINNTLLHLYIQQPSDDQLPGINAWFGTEFNRNNTWFSDMDIFLKYIKRCNLMLQQGKYVADVAYFISEDTPKMTGVKDPDLPNGYSFDYINAEVIKTRLTVKDGRLSLPDGMSYKVLVLPKLETIRPELLLKIKDLVNRGAVLVGPRPSRSPSLQNFGKADAEVRKTASELWGKIDGSAIKINKFGKGMVIDGMNLDEVFKLLNLFPDCRTNPTDSVLYIHRKLKQGSIYFISNQQNAAINISPEFRISDKIPELWDANTGRVRDLPQYEQTKKGISVPLVLAPYESAFVIFRKNKPGKHVVKLAASVGNYPESSSSIALNGDWQVTFDSKMRGPLKPVTFTTLQDWRSNLNDSIKYYSGAAYYRQNFNAPEIKNNEHVFLNLGKVNVIAKVRINGKELGGVWTAPYKIDISAALKSGNNTLEVKVVNTWVNRLIGDSALPEKDRKTFATFNKYTPNSALKPSGLLGPVKLEITSQ